MNCNWCSLPFQPNEFKVDLQEDFFHADCWMKKIQSIGRNATFGPAKRRDGLYPSPRERTGEPTDDGD